MTRDDIIKKLLGEGLSDEERAEIKLGIERMQVKYEELAIRERNVLSDLARRYLGDSETLDPDVEAMRRLNFGPFRIGATVHELVNPKLQRDERLREVPFEPYQVGYFLKWGLRPEHVDDFMLARLMTTLKLWLPVIEAHADEVTKRMLDEDGNLLTSSWDDCSED